VTAMFLALSVLLGGAKLVGELAQKIDQPAVLGEILAGILLGPTVLGNLTPRVYATLFPSMGVIPIVIDSVTTIGVVLFLLTAGIEVDLSSLFRPGKCAVLVTPSGGSCPLRSGWAAAWALPRFFAAEPGADRVPVASFGA